MKVAYWLVVFPSEIHVINIHRKIGARPLNKVYRKDKMKAKAKSTIRVTKRPTNLFNRMCHTNHSPFDKFALMGFLSLQFSKAPYGEVSETS